MILNLPPSSRSNTLPLPAYSAYSTSATVTRTLPSLSRLLAALSPKRLPDFCLVTITAIFAQSIAGHVSTRKVLAYFEVATLHSFQVHTSLCSKTSTMGTADKGKRKADVVDLTLSSDDDAPHTPPPRKQVKTQTATPATSSHPRQARAASAYKTPQPSNSDRSSHALLTPPASSSQGPGSSALPFDDDEEIEDGVDYENLESYGVINGIIH